MYVLLQRFKGPYSRVLTSPFSSGRPSLVVRQFTANAHLLILLARYFFIKLQSWTLSVEVP